MKNRKPKRKTRLLNNSDIREYAKSRGVMLWELAISMNISEPTITRKLRLELSDADKATIKGHIDKIAAEKAKRSGVIT